MINATDDAARRAMAFEIREQVMAEWMSLTTRSIELARQQERERCAALAEDLDLQESPPGYEPVRPVLDLPVWERAQSYHASRIAAAIRGYDPDEAPRLPKEIRPDVFVDMALPQNCLPG